MFLLKLSPLEKFQAEHSLQRSVSESEWVISIHRWRLSGRHLAWESETGGSELTSLSFPSINDDRRVRLWCSGRRWGCRISERSTARQVSPQLQLRLIE